MRFLLTCFVISALGSVAASASAQRTIAYDTLSGESPVAVTCGFCAGEKFGVIYRDLPPPARGLDADDFPIQLEGLQLALASADAIGSGTSFTCSGSTMGGQASIGIAVYAGTALPSDIQMLSEDDVWPGETLVWSSPDVPAERSVADEDGSASYEVNFNRLLLEDEAGLPFRVEAPNVYIRVVISLNPDTILMSASCEALSLEAPSGFAVRDNDGLIANERNFIFADGAGWLWSEGAGIGGDWALRLEIIAEGSSMEDASVMMPDTGPADTGTMPADASADTGAPPDDTGGCDASGGGVGSGGPLALFVFSLWAIGRRRRRV